MYRIFLLKTMFKGKAIIDLRPNRELLNPHFESYKLSLDQCESSEVKLENEIHQAYDPQFCASFHHAKVFSDFNALVVNHTASGDSQVAAIVDRDGNLFLLDLNRMFEIKKVWSVPKVSDDKKMPISKCFIDENRLMINDGLGMFYILKISNAPDFHVQVEWSGSFKCDDKPISSVLIDNSKIDKDGGNIFLMNSSVESCSLLPEWVRSKLSASAANSTSEESGYCSVVYWHRLSQQGGSTCVDCLGKFVSASPLSVALMSPDGGVVLGGERPFINILLPNEFETEHESKNGHGGHLYSWHQDKEFVTISFPFIHLNTAKDDVKVEIKKDSVLVKVDGKGEQDNFELCGNFGGDVNVEASSWLFDDSPEFVKDPYARHPVGRKVVLKIAKAEPGSTWVSCIAGDERGHMVLTEEQLEFVRFNVFF